jgi:hypothetical protein
MESATFGQLPVPIPSPIVPPKFAAGVGGSIIETGGCLQILYS